MTDHEPAAAGADSQTEARLAYAAVQGTEKCPLCGRNPCRGHAEQTFVRELVAAGLLWSAPATVVHVPAPRANWSHLRPHA